MILIVWNVRGLNDPSKVADVRQLLHRTKSELICLMETRVKQHKSSGIQKKISYGLTWDRVVGGIRAIGPMSLPWICTGDFNSVLQTDDRINGSEVTDYEVRDFKEFVEDMNFMEIQSKRSYFSWSNKAHVEARTLTRIDTGLINFEWLLQFPNVEAVYISPSLSDHTPLLYEIFPPSPRKGKPFRFLNCLITHPDFMSLVQEVWNNGVQGNPMNRIWKKLKNLKVQLKDLNLNSFCNVDERVDLAQQALLDIQDQMALDLHSFVLMEQETTAINQLKYWRSVQESIYRQKSKVDWVKLGDSNTKYIFSMVKHRKS
ncbi:uncharacterized protein LOC110716881 [Chenopodium quinoa]|uniref:uncharacterized protein LOC110716881 n=1 Tax=Chenopodium quinoa TaxID=63459 RepID=UPI000B790944|nr:uncharacterized protein LOC110716881 [Chenopodium quinoa]